MKSNLWCALVLCSAGLTWGMHASVARAEQAENALECNELCRAWLGLSPEPEAEIGPPRTFRAKLSRSRAAKIDYYFYLNEDCSQPGLVQIDVIKPPRAGLLAANTGVERAFYPPGNRRSACNGQKTWASRLFYMRDAGTARSDNFSVVATYPDSTWEEVHYDVPRR